MLIPFSFEPSIHISIILHNMSTLSEFLSKFHPPQEQTCLYLHAKIDGRLKLYTEKLQHWKYGSLPHEFDILTPSLFYNNIKWLELRPILIKKFKSNMLVLSPSCVTALFHYWVLDPIQIFLSLGWGWSLKSFRLVYKELSISPIASLFLGLLFRKGNRDLPSCNFPVSCYYMGGVDHSSPTVIQISAWLP